MALSDAALFEKWRTANDADAFAELLSRHANMVYGACLRVVKNPSLAEDVAQDSFLELMKGPDDVRSVGAWLHTVATRRALDRLKTEGRRVEREAIYADASSTVEHIAIDDTLDFVDEAIAALPEELGVPIVLRFLEGRPQKEIAQELGLSRSAVRLRIDKGIGLVRATLEKRGVLCTAAALTTVLESVPAEAVPPRLLASLGKCVLAHAPAPAFLASVATAKYAFFCMAVLVFGIATHSTIKLYRQISAPVATVDNTAEVGAGVTSSETPVPMVAHMRESNGAQESDNDVDTTMAPPATLESEKAPNGHWTLNLTASEETQEKLANLVNVDFDDIHIQDVVEFFQDSQRMNFVLDGRVVAPEEPSGNLTDPRFPQAYVTDGYVRNVSLRDTRLDEALTIILRPLNLTYKVIGSAVWVSSSSQITLDLARSLPTAPFIDGAMQATLESPANIEFEHIHLSSFLEFLEFSFEVKSVSDSRVVMPEARLGEKPPPWVPSYATNGMISYIQLREATVGEVLFVFTRLLGLTYRVEEEAVYISTPDLVKELSEEVLANFQSEVDSDYEIIQPSLTGTVTLPDGTPFVNAQIAIENVESIGNWKERIRVDTDESGYYSVYGLEAATYQLQLAEPGIERWSEFNDVGLVTLTTGEVRSGVDFVFGSEGNLTASGIVVNSAGEPLPGARVVNTVAASPGGVTDAFGRFDLRFLPAGKIMLHTELRGYSSIDQIAMAGVQEIRIELLKPGGVAGKVVDGVTGKPIAEFEVAYLNYHATGIQEDMLSDARRFRDDQGAFRINRVSAGNVTVLARAPGYRTAVVTTSVEEEKVRDEIVLRLAQIRPMPLRGEVVSSAGEPVVDAKIYLSRMGPPEKRDQNVAAVSDADGAFEVVTSSVEQPFITAWHPDFAPGSATLRETSTITLEKAGRLNVEVFSDGTPVTSTAVRIFYPGDRRLGFEMTAPTDEAGLATLGEILPGPVEIEVVLPGNRCPYTQVHIAPGEERSVRIDVARPTATVEGVVVQDGYPISTPMLTFFIETELGTERIRRGVSPDGTFRVQQLPLGRAMLVASCEDGAQQVLVDPVPLSADKVTSVTADMTIAHWIEGKVSGVPADRRATVVLLRGAMKWEEAIKADYSMIAGQGDVGVQGAFKLAAHRTGAYTLLLRTCPTSDPVDTTDHEIRVVEVSDEGAPQVEF